jgi:decaprenylphospho-beta-D-ribofuranose 2-oxidase
MIPPTSSLDPEDRVRAAPAPPHRNVRLRAMRSVLTSFDGGTAISSLVERPDRYRDLERLPASVARIVRGSGHSYAAASFGGGALVQDGSAFNRILAFDERARRLRCEGGATLGAVFRFAQPRGLGLRIQPGHPDLTIGGCIATEAHGKHPARDGTFSSQVTDVTLFHPRHGWLDVSHESRPEILELTCGGYGLTGQVVAATLQLHPIAPAYRVSHLPVRSLTETVEVLERHAPTVVMQYSWNDLASSASFGRGHVVIGESADEAPAPGASPAPASWEALPAHAGGPLPCWNAVTARAFNALYERTHRRVRTRGRGTFETSFPIARRTMYFRLFGRRGFHESQVLVPRSRFDEFERSLARGIGRFGVSPTLGSCKLFDGAPSLLRFAGSGVAVALDFPRSRSSAQFLAWLDDLCVDLDALPNPIKDSRLPRRVVERSFPGYANFVAGLERFDRDRIYRSELSERLRL